MTVEAVREHALTDTGPHVSADPPTPRWWVRWLDAVTLVAAAGMVGLVLSVIRGVSAPSPVLALQGLLPILLAPAVVFAVVSARQRWRWRTALFAAVAVVHLAWCLPQATADSSPAWVAGAPTFTILAANLRFDSADHQAAVQRVMDIDADVVVLSEVTPEVPSLLRDAGAHRRYRTWLSEPGTPFATLMMSRLPVSRGELVWVGSRAMPVFDVSVGGRRVEIWGVHTESPSRWSTRVWSREQTSLNEAIGSPQSDELVMLAGDFNESAWNSPYRRLLNQGFSDCHDVRGEGLSPSWGPVELGSVPLLRIDRCVFSAGLWPVAVGNRDIPGSDHVGFEVTVAVRGA